MPKISLIQDIKQSQKMALTPQLLKAIKLLELNNIELDDYLEKEILDNPLLEKENNNEGDLRDDSLLDSEDFNDVKDNDSDFFEYIGESAPVFDTSNLYDTSSSNKKIDNVIEETLPSKESLFENILNQINITFKTKIDRLIASAIVEFIEPNGYLKVSINELSADLNISPLKIEKILLTLKTFEPVGIFSQNLEEFLAIQLKEIGYLDKTTKILIDNLTKLATGNINSLVKDCGVEKDVVLKKLDYIKRCQSAPIDINDYLKIETYPPDIIVKKIKSNWSVSLNEETLPKVVVLSGYWEELSKKKLSKDDKKYLTSNLISGKGIVKALEQRAATILKVSNVIMKRQVKFLEEGIMFIKPLKLKDIAEELDIHESTVSRITNSKTISTPRGTYELRFFFSTSLTSSMDLGGLSSKVVKEKISQLINHEDMNVLSDNKLSILLKSQGINVARRTVTKYREEMNLPQSHKRKRLKLLAV